MKKPGRAQRKIGLNAEHQAIYRKIGAELGMDIICAYGSRVRGDWDSERSDWDFMVVPPPQDIAAYRSRCDQVSKKLGIKLDPQFSKLYPSHGALLSIKENKHGQ